MDRTLEILERILALLEQHHVDQGVREAESLLTPFEVQRELALDEAMLKHAPDSPMFDGFSEERRRRNRNRAMLGVRI